MERLFRNAAFLIDPEEEQSYSQATRDILSYVRENCPGPLSLSEIAKDRSWNIDYMIRYRAQGIVSVLETWVQDDLREPAAVIAQIMAVLDGSIEDQFTDWMQKHG